MTARAKRKENHHKLFIRVMSVFLAVLIVGGTLASLIGVL